MARSPTRNVIDTNVPKIANLSVNISEIPVEMLECTLSCVEVIQEVIDKKRALVLDAGGEIFAEYRKQLSMSGQPGLGDAFVQWVHDNQWNFAEENRVEIQKNGTSYSSFPEDENLADFDISDMKFVAVANASNVKPPILVASDHKWWTFRDQLAAHDIIVDFLCPAQIEVVSNRKSKKNAAKKIE